MIPSRLTRAVAYAFAWLPPLLIFSLVVVQFEPIFVKLAEKNLLPTYPRWALSLIQWNRVYWYLPTIVTLVFLVAAAEYSLFASGKQRLGVWIWRSEIVASALFAWYFIVRSVMWSVTFHMMDAA